MGLCDVGVDDRGGSTVQEHSPEEVAGGVTVDIAAVEDQVRGGVDQSGLCAAERNDLAERRHALGDCELETDQPVAARAGRRLDDGHHVGRDQLRQDRCKCWIDAGSRRG